IAGALEGNPSPTSVDQTAGNGQSLDFGQNSARLFERIKQLFVDLHHQAKNTKMVDNAEMVDDTGMVNDTGLGKGEASPGAKPSEPIFGPPVQSAENADVTSQWDIRGAGQTPKGVPEKPEFSSQVNEKPKEAAAAEKTVADSSGSKEETVFWRMSKPAGRVETAGQIPAARGLGRPNNAETILDNQAVKQTVPAGLKMESGSPPNDLSQAAAGEEPSVRTSQESPTLKDADVKVFSGMKEETVAKVIKTETGSTESGLLNSQNHPMEKAAENTTLPKEAESDRSSLKTQTLDQIVQRAAIHLKNGQHEARIDLKPEYLGHIRMQVISENHQVTVKILAEHGFVKDMLENNGHQLKADLQQQGLHIDKLEVSVSRDLDDSGNPKERLTGMRTRQGVADNGKQGHPGQDLPQHKRQPRRTISAETTVDYFA
ncbi:MAG: flagellar hook-length control protein FliK, partial [Desulfobacterales bacterium]